MDVHPLWEPGCTSMVGTCMYIHGGNLDVHPFLENECTSMVKT
jgi:hypothetical protein